MAKRSSANETKLREKKKISRDVDERLRLGVDKIGVLEVDCCTCPDRNGGLNRIKDHLLSHNGNSQNSSMHARNIIRLSSDPFHGHGHS